MQFSARKAKMQWWYYDFFSDEIVGVLAFIPRKWWPNTQGSGKDDSFVMLSLRKANGTIEKYCESIDSNLIRAESNKLKLGQCIDLEYWVAKGRVHHKINFVIDKAEGFLEISPNSPPFSALPLGKLSGLARRLAYRSEWSASPFRYVSQIPSGHIKGQIITAAQKHTIVGRAYHEQGWFDDEPHRLNKGWYWFHFLHPECNIFGLPEGYVYVQLKDQVLLGGMCLFVEKYWIEKQQFDNPTSSNILTGGQININANGIEIRLNLDSDTNQELIEFNSVNSRQLWNTSVVESNCSILVNDQRLEFSGKAMLETCWLEQ